MVVFILLKLLSKDICCMDSLDKIKDMYFYIYKSLVIVKLEIEFGWGKKVIKLICVYNFNVVILFLLIIFFCNILDFIIKILIVWKYIKCSFSVYIYKNILCRGR